MKPSGSVPLLDCVTVLQDDEFYFSDEEPESVQNRKPGVNYDPELRDGVNNEALSNKVRRAVSALRSISFQMNTTEDLDTAWGQAHVLENARKKGTGGMMCGSVGSKWRRPRARGLSKGSVVEYGMSDCFSDSDVLSAASYNSTTSCKDRGFGGARRDALRCVPPSRVRNTLQGQYKKSLWSGGRRDRQPQARAAQILVSNGGRGFLAASNPDSALTVVPGEVLERTGECRRSVDKYVEFIHASAQRETRIHQKNMKRRFIGKMFRKRRN